MLSSTIRRTIPHRALPLYLSAHSSPSQPSNPYSTQILSPDPPPNPTQENLPPEQAKDQPRWAKTPVAMVAPVRARAKPQRPFPVNESPRRLEEAYVRMLGPGAEHWLSEETRWLAVTHKSFDQGRRGFNDRLAYLGKRIIDLQASLALLNNPAVSKRARDRLRKQREEGSQDEDAPFPEPDVIIRPAEIGKATDGEGPAKRERFIHPALEGLENLSDEVRYVVTEKRRMAQLAENYGLGAVTRWKPRMVGNLRGSGVETVYAQTLFAVIGALALERGGELATRVVREKVLLPLGLRL